MPVHLHYAQCQSIHPMNTRCSYLHQTREAASNEDLCSRGWFTLTVLTTLRLSEEIEGITVRAKDNWIDEAGGQHWKCHALEESMDLIWLRKNEQSVLCHVSPLGDWECLGSDIWWNTYPFTGVCFRHTVKYPLVHRLGLQSHLSSKGELSQMISCMDSDIFKVLVWHSTLTVSNGCPIVSPRAPGVNSKEMLFT